MLQKKFIITLNYLFLFFHTIFWKGRGIFELKEDEIRNILMRFNNYYDDNLLLDEEDQKLLTQNDDQGAWCKDWWYSIATSRNKKQITWTFNFCSKSYHSTTMQQSTWLRAVREHTFQMFFLMWSINSERYYWYICFYKKIL